MAYSAICFEFLTLVQTTFSLLVTSLLLGQSNRVSSVLLRFYLIADGPFNLCGPALTFQALITHIVMNTASLCHLLGGNQITYE